ncbi:hypothetical protein N7452_003687 [Penicillium brevicompactum]|uniref:Uncharacterized protein n=1 Tax=Penicillium brevicompactum TaxID=5074 RepID=A0A9W9UKZ1_PENBR|nr:hypothetical protein N7452_003687 [Penicillium brevicompactum]
MTLEHYLQCVEFYRSTSVPDRVPSPENIEFVASLEKVIMPLYPEISAILDQYELGKSETLWDLMSFFCLRTTNPNYPRGDNPVDLFAIGVNHPDFDISPLGPIKDEILELFRRHNIKAHVEIANDRHTYRPSFFFIASDHPLVKAYDQVKHRIVAIITRSTGSNFNMICPFNVGRTAAKAQPTIVVLIEPWTIANWYELRLQIVSQLLPHMGTDVFDVEFLPGGLSVLNNGIPFTHEITEQVPRMGSSIGIQGGRNAGTLGGFVTLTQRDDINGDVVRRGFLTNYHVVRPSEGPSDNSHFLERLDRFGSSPDCVVEKITMESPARIDTDATATKISKSLEAMRTFRNGFNAKEQERETLGATPNCPAKPNSEDLEMVSRVDEDIEDWSFRQTTVQSMPYTLGEVKFVSGKEVRDGRVMDWAFVELSKDAEKFFEPNYMPSVPYECEPYHWGPSHVPPLVLTNGDPLEEFVSLKDGDYCLKKGRSTGLTAGVVNGPKAYCNWETPRETDSGRNVDTYSSPTEEFIILGAKTDRNNSSCPAFCMDGDSGSFVLSQWGEVSGLLWGGTSFQQYNIGLASSMPDVLASIQEKVGGSVELSLPT